MHRIIFYIKSEIYGNGHYVRAKNIRKKFRNKYKIKLVNLAKIEEQKKLFNIIDNVKEVIFDISNEFFLRSNKKFLLNLFSKFKNNTRINVIDSIFPNTILNFCKKLKIKNYINADILYLKKPKNIKNLFLGPKYLIGLNKFKLVKNNNKNNILIFLTASKSSLNTKLLRFIKKEKNFFLKYKIKFITNDPNILKKKFNELKFIKFLQIQNRLKLSDYLKRTNIVISGQGNFKYEILLSKIPLIIIANNDLYISFKKRFKNTPIVNQKKLSHLKKYVLKMMKLKKNKKYFDILNFNKIFFS